jgi:hypothetical protein
MSVVEEKQRGLQKIKFSWTSDASGDASVVSDTEFTGKIIEVVTIPASGGSQPTDQYDITIGDGDSIDVLHGNGVNRSNASNEYITEANSGAVVNDKLTLTVSNAGDTKSGSVVVFVR